MNIQIVTIFLFNAIMTFGFKIPVIQHDTIIQFSDVHLMGAGISGTSRLSIDYNLTKHEISYFSTELLIADNMQLKFGKMRPELGVPKITMPFYDEQPVPYTTADAFSGDTTYERVGIGFAFVAQMLRFDMGVFGEPQVLRQDSLCVPINLRATLGEKGQISIGGVFVRGEERRKLTSAVMGWYRYSQSHAEWIEVTYNTETRSFTASQDIRVQIPFLPLEVENRVEERITKDIKQMPVRLTTLLTLRFSGSIRLGWRITASGTLQQLKDKEFVVNNRVNLTVEF